MGGKLIELKAGPKSDLSMTRVSYASDVFAALPLTDPTMCCRAKHQLLSSTLRAFRAGYIVCAIMLHYCIKHVCHERDSTVFLTPCANSLGTSTFQIAHCEL